MKIDRAKYLANALVKNQLSRQELEDFLSGLGDEEILQIYSEIFEDHFGRLIEKDDRRIPPPEG
jgi:hypothetical protein